MREYSTQEIKQEIIQHKKNCAAQEQLEAQLRRDGTDMPFHLIQRLSELKMHNEMVKSWLSLLSEDEEYVIRRHLIHELTWPRLETEYQSIWKEYGKERRTLMRYQKNALERIYRSIQDENSLFDGNER